MGESARRTSAYHFVFDLHSICALAQICAVVATAGTIPTGRSAGFRFLGYDGTDEGLAPAIREDIAAAGTTRASKGDRYWRR